MKLGRRALLGGALAAGAVSSIQACRGVPRWERRAVRQTPRSRVAILPAPAYDDSLVEVMLRGLRLFTLPLLGKRIVLKPNFVEHDPNGVVNTHPTLVAAAIEAFRRLGASQIIVAEGPGHYRDTEHLLTATGLHAVLREHRTRYVDLNNDDVRALPLASHYTPLDRLYLPETLLSADLLVSMPKLKTHHWAGVTLSLKNMFGCIPGAIYGWPKNVLHWAGIHESIVDINSTLPVPRFAIVDGLVGMEGNGPIQGEAKRCGALLFGDDLVAVDATAARLMTIDPHGIRYLTEAGRFLGHVHEERIEQLGAPIEQLRKDFRVLPKFQALKRFA
ncbi:MAG TPA: DUF362 domain-containing protein [Gemmatimonadales bacterium]|jgi:uncharacterized protein (DUF362 family)|nr:DUF362 domain-containing protein [Gemmatimonadales bacterium]